MNWWLTRFREPSTWRGLVWLATVAGHTSPRHVLGFIHIPDPTSRY